MRHDQQPDYYDILGVRRSATPEEIRHAYRKAMRAVHPDASGTSGLFRMVKTAYDTLSDPRERASYDAGVRTASPPPPPPGPPPPEQSSPKPPRPEPPPRPGPEASAAPPPRSPRATAPPPPERPVAPVRTAPASGTRARPRFGAHWIQVAVIGVWTAVLAAAAYALWPAAVPAGLYLLLLLPVAAAPLLAASPTGSRVWPWSVCAVPFAGGAVLAAGETGAGAFWPYCGVLAGLALGGTGLALAPLLVRHGRELDRLVGPDCLDHEIFNVPGAGLTLPGARDVARISGARLEGLATMPGVRIIHSLAAPLPSGSGGYVAHALLRDDRLALVMVRELAGDGAAAVQAFRTAVPHGVRVRGFVALVDGASAGQTARTGTGDVFTGSLSQIHAELAAWLEPAAPVIRRRTLAALLGHVHT